MRGRRSDNRWGLELRAAPSDGGSGSGGDGGSSSGQDVELRRMAAFRVREAANRLVVLANGAQTVGLRAELLEICQILLREERALLGGSDGGGDGEA